MGNGTESAGASGPGPTTSTLDQQPVYDVLALENQPELRAMIAHQVATFMFTVFGNLLMVFVILRNNAVLRRKRITPVQMLMLHMCTSDLLFALLTVFPTLVMTITVPNFYGPDLLCKFVKFLQVSGRGFWLVLVLRSTTVPLEIW